MGALDGAAAALVNRVEPWAVYALLGIAALVLMLYVLNRLGIVVPQRGATAKDIEGIFDRRVNGDLKHLRQAVDALAAEVRANRATAEDRHAENQSRLGRIEGQLGSRWDGRERRRT